MEHQSESREAAAPLPRLRSLIAMQLVSQILVLVDRLVRYGFRWSSRASYDEGWFRWESGFDIFAVVSLQFTIDSTKANNAIFHSQHILFFGLVWSSVRT